MTVMHPKTLRELRARYWSKLEQEGFDQKAIQLVHEVFENSLRTDSRRTYSEIRIQHNKSLAKLRWLEGKRIISQADNHYEVDFSAFALLLCANRRTAVSIRTQTDNWLNAGKRWLDGHRNDHTVAAHLLFGAKAYEDIPPIALTALKLLSFAHGGIHLTGAERRDVLLMDIIFDTPDTLKLAASTLDSMITRPMSFPGTFDLSPSWYGSLKLSKEAYADAEKAIARCDEQPDSAIGSARAALESAFKWIAHDAGLGLPSSPSPGQMLTSCKPALGLDRPHSETLARALANLCYQIGNIRNELSDVHGREPNATSATRAEARLVVGSALLLAAYLMDRREAAKLQGRMG